MRLWILVLALVGCTACVAAQNGATIGHDAEEWEHGYRTEYVIATRYKNKQSGYNIGFKFPKHPYESDAADIPDWFAKHDGVVITGGGYPGAETFVVFKAVKDRESANAKLRVLVPQLSVYMTIPIKVRQAEPVVDEPYKPTAIITEGIAASVSQMDEFSEFGDGVMTLSTHYSYQTLDDTVFVTFNGRYPKWEIVFRGTSEWLKDLRIVIDDASEPETVHARRERFRSDIRYYAEEARDAFIEGQFAACGENLLDLAHLYFLDAYRPTELKVATK